MSEQGEGELRYRGAKLYSQESEDSKEPASDVPEEKLKERDGESERDGSDAKGNSAQVLVVAQSMFDAMCKDLGKNVITKETVGDAVHNLFSVDPSKSLLPTKGYAESSEAMKTLIERLLYEVLGRNNTKEVGHH